MPIIFLFGADGSGKTTLAKALAKRLNNRGLRVKLSWMRGTHTLASFLARLLSTFTAFRGSENPYYETTIPRSLKRLWQFLEFASLLPILLTRFLIPSWLGYLVIAERYIPDFLVWISITTNDPNYLKSLNAKFLLTLTLKAKVKVYVTAELPELLKRREHTNPLFIQKQLILYEKITRNVNAFKLDTTNKSVNKSVDNVLNLIELNPRKL